MPYSHGALISKKQLYLKGLIQTKNASPPVHTERGQHVQVVMVARVSKKKKKKKKAVGLW